MLAQPQHNGPTKPQSVGNGAADRLCVPRWSPMVVPVEGWFEMVWALGMMVPNLESECY